MLNINTHLSIKKQDKIKGMTEHIAFYDKLNNAGGLLISDSTGK